jgi:protocatechuate 3,4-dioxygenase beta subunit
LIDEHFVLRRECPRGWRLASYAFCATAALALSLVTIAAEPVNDTRPTSADEVKSADGSSENKSEQKVLVSTDASKPQADPNPQKALFELYRKHFKLPEPNVVGGFVVDEKLQPIAQAKVSVFRTNWRDYTRKLIAEKSTDADGKVRFDQVFDIAKEFPGGKIPPDYGIGEELLQVVVRAPGRVTDSRFQARQLVAKRGEPLMIIMPPATTLRGRVTGPDGKPVAGFACHGEAVIQSSKLRDFYAARARSRNNDRRGKS